MFDQFKGMASIAALMKDLPRLKERMEEVKRRLGEITVEADTGGGAVRAVANGQLRIVSVHVDPAMLSGLVDPANADDRAVAEDLITGAVNAALTKAREAAEQEMRTTAADLGIALPPGMEGLLS
ncbi:MAG: YbaB/EbfC family nucleoid-associated protein [Planctomycetes bacterium]|nr:YbaB/EbfC family nucleoid-associated protein [Planctomycetota bacterium]